MFCTCRILAACTRSRAAAIYARETSMEINGPLKVGVVEPSPEGNYERHITFTDAFKATDLAQQGE